VLAFPSRDAGQARERKFKGLASHLKWETVDSIVDEWKSYIYFLGNTTHTSETSLYILLHPEL
jgi:hypothetical protein